MAIEAVKKKLELDKECYESTKGYKEKIRNRTVKELKVKSQWFHQLSHW